MKYLTNTSVDPYFNMAFDEYCLQTLGPGEDCFYLWRNSPSVIIGMNQNAYGEVNIPYLEEHGINLVRRVTGGGAVYHDLQNLNYTIIGSHPSPQVVCNALRSLGVDAELTGRNDIFVDGRKVSGYARRVWKDREMIHGTLMWDVDIDTLTRALDTDGSKMRTKGIASVRSRVANLSSLLPRFAGIDEFQAAMQTILAAGDGPLALPQDALAQIAENADRKFRSWDWIYGHSREAGLVLSRKLACGRVSATISLDHGIMQSVEFSGDFMGGRPSDELSALLKGVKYERSSIEAALSDIDAGDWFEGSGNSELVSLLTDVEGDS